MNDPLCPKYAESDINYSHEVSLCSLGLFSQCLSFIASLCSFLSGNTTDYAQICCKEPLDSINGVAQIAISKKILVAFGMQDTLPVIPKNHRLLGLDNASWIPLLSVPRPCKRPPSTSPRRSSVSILKSTCSRNAKAYEALQDLMDIISDNSTFPDPPSMGSYYKSGEEFTLWSCYVPHGPIVSMLISPQYC
ncbi:uncharacterized protein M421DRAFT_424570 [Didymella exigua CBS 183.55]|uniref:Uncharacterized protein n=1 Tax=Didymella exigua CBS 183.55 TaxID=1150837 RepID=A0A6A5R8X8_9PLEO|nr:uncharacterized protein M421DRAFT_424570 [Didymella exigua CBS 183.55]KAF1924685.1 hypothetical protein M421DRAFT_424570 [Didymella exigua CBS 183.55]